MFSSIISESIEVTDFIICMFSSFILGLVTSLVYMKTSKTSKNFLISLSVLPTLVAVVIMLVNGNLGTSVAVLGAFSLIRFRSVPGSSKEIVAVFFSMAIGLAIGCGYIGYATLFTIIVSIIMYILNSVKFDEEKKLVITVPEDLDYTNCFNEDFEKYLKSYKIEKAKTTNMGSLFEVTYNVKFKNEKDEKEFVDNIRVKNGNLKIMITNSLNGEVL